jgi:cell division protein FtsI/penicillin-binding protein 2
MILYALVVTRLVFLQIIDRDIYVARATQQVEENVTVYPLRGEIYDRNGNTLAHSIKTFKLSADVYMIKDSMFFSVANQISYITRRSAIDYLKIMKSATGRIAIIEKELSSEQAERILKLDINGLILEEKSRRKYPFGTLGSHILGYVNFDSEGLGGIEKQYDKLLKGESGNLIIQRDAKGRASTVLHHKSQKVKNGCDLYLTIDREMQRVLEEELSKGVANSNALNGMGLIVEPNTGEILALSNYPSFNPIEYSSATNFERRNRAVTDMYELGSTFKIVTLAGILESGTMKPDDIVYAENGVYQIMNVKINDTQPHKNLTVSEAMQYSSNIAFVKFSEKLGAEELFKYVRNFGFGTRTGIDLPGEISGDLGKLKKLDKLASYFVSHGYSIGISPIQLIMAYAAVINGGKLVIPYVVNKVVSDDGEVLKDIKPNVVRNVISESTSKVLRRILFEVIENGTGKLAKIEGLAVGGKTGTAQKLINGKYSKEFHILSFAGFYPIEGPKFLCLIILDSPKGNYYGGAVAAPIFKRIGERLFKLQAEDKLIEKNLVYHKTSGELLFPSLIGKEKSEALKIGRSFDVGFEFRGDGQIITSQIYNQKQKHITFVLGEVEKPTKSTQVPNVIGLSLREAINQMTLANIRVTVEGNGYVIRQSLEVGNEVPLNSVCKLVCSKDI